MLSPFFIEIENFFQFSLFSRRIILETGGSFRYNDWVYANTHIVNHSMRGFDYMSASSKKKLRKEQQAAAMTERQQQEQKEAKKLKRNTIIFVTVIGLVLLAFVGILVYQWITSNGIFEKATTAATVNGTEINSVEMNYYYVDTALEQCNQLYSYASYFGGDLSTMGLDTSKPLSKQVYNEESGQTWADYILELAIDNAQHDYALAAAAKKAGYELSDEDQQTLKTYSKNMDANAKALGYESADQLLAQQYGNGAEKDTYLAYLKRGMIANGYYNEYSDSLSFDDAAIRERDEKNPLNYNSYDYSYYYVNYSNYLEGGTENDEGETEYSADEENAARAKAKEIADQLATAGSLDELDAAVKELEVNGAKNQKLTTAHKTLYTKITASHQEWVAAEDRQEGDITVIENKSTAAEGEEALINGYYVLCYEGMSTNDLGKMSSVRHLLVEFETEEEDETEEDHEGHDHAEESEPTEVTESTEETTEATQAATEEVTEPVEEVTEPTETEGEEQTETEGEEATEPETETEEEGVSEEVRQAALAEAERLLAEWKNGDATEDSFAALVTDNTDDTASAETGGLYENIHAGSDYVEAFLAWAIDPARQVGDVEIVETEYGYHIMYFVGWEELTYRDQLILDELKNEAFETWYNGLIEAKPAKKGNTKYVLKEMLLSDFGY